MDVNGDIPKRIENINGVIENMRLLIKYWKYSKRGMRQFFLGALLSSFYQIVYVLLVRWCSLALENYEHPSFYITLIVAGCTAITLIIIPGRYYHQNSRNLIFRDLEMVFENKILSADYAMFDEYSPSKIITLEDKLYRISQSVSIISNLISSAMAIITTAFAVTLINPLLLFGIIVIYIICTFMCIRSFKKIATCDKAADTEWMKRNEERHATIDGFNEVRCFCKEEEHRMSLRKQNEKILKHFIEKHNHEKWLECSFEMLSGIITVASILFSISLIKRDIITPAVAMSIILYMWQVMDPMINIIAGMDELSATLSMLPELDKFMEYKNTVEDGNIDLLSFNKEIKFQNVSYFYKDSNHVLKNINLIIKKGQKIGICGATGGGKTTLLKLLLRFYDPSEGEISIDGIDIRYLTTKSLRRHIGIVSQNTFIFNGTIFDNIQYANSNASAKQIVDASKKAAIYDFVMSLPDKFNTYVGPKGLKLSGGQKQRIALARIFLYDPDIILLDEATASLDNECENIVQESFAAFKNKTVIAVAHRLSTIEDSDKIIVIDNHGIAETGTHEELIEKKGIYEKLYKS